MKTKKREKIEDFVAGLDGEEVKSMVANLVVDKIMNTPALKARVRSDPQEAVAILEEMGSRSSDPEVAALFLAKIAARVGGTN